MVLWTQENLDSHSFEYLRSLPSIPQEHAKFTVTHASPRHPIWEYITSTRLARENFDFFDTPYCLVGHTHVPLLFRLALDARTRRMSCTGHLPVRRPRHQPAGRASSDSQPRQRRPAARQRRARSLSAPRHRPGSDVLSPRALRCRDDAGCDARGRPARTPHRPYCLRLVGCNQLAAIRICLNNRGVGFVESVGADACSHPLPSKSWFRRSIEDETSHLFVAGRCDSGCTGRMRSPALKRNQSIVTSWRTGCPREAPAPRDGFRARSLPPATPVTVVGQGRDCARSAQNHLPGLCQHRRQGPGGQPEGCRGAGSQRRRLRVAVGAEPVLRRPDAAARS